MIRIQEISQKCKIYLKLLQKNDIYTALIIILVGLGGFGLGRLSTIEENKIPISVDYNFAGAGAALKKENSSTPNAKSFSPSDLNENSSGGVVVASKSGKKYYYHWCSGVSRISPANKISFPSEEAARKSGYEPAANCKGMTK